MERSTLRRIETQSALSSQSIPPEKVSACSASQVCRVRIVQVWIIFATIHIPRIMVSQFLMAFLRVPDWSCEEISL